MDVVLWCGPVSASNLSRVVWQRPTTVVTVNHRDWPGPQQGPARPEITGSAAFGQLAARMGARPLSRILEIAGVGSADKIAICGFSAGHGLLDPILRSPDASLVSALGSFDAYFTNETQTVKPGYLAFCQRAARGEVLAIITTSSNGGENTPPADVSFARLNAQIAGVEDEAPPAGVPAPAAMVGAGLYGWADYRGLVTHEGHARELAAPWLSAVVAPYLAGETTGLASEGSAAGGASVGKVAFVGAVLVAVVLVAQELAG